MGTVCTGIRSLTWRMISKDVDPLPSSTAARRDSTMAGESASTCSTSSRERMWSLSSSSSTGGTIPER
ncbi:hypothetical protein [Ornithinimicrobium flavum]|uniref:hypothetical protein n=1 Tax=Ornithinimicrobium flavum TaxID=1288636 RepID=UPI001930F645|nr:hypothetical protein [Ornithinimicrobium flavum]